MPGVLYARVNGAWVPIPGSGGGGGGSDEVWVGPDDPIGDHPTTELWVDTDDPGTLSEDARWNTAWGVVVPPTGAGNTTVAGTATVVRSATGLLTTGRRYRANVDQLSTYCSTAGDSWVVELLLDSVVIGTLAYSVDAVNNYLPPATTGFQFTAATGSRVLELRVTRAGGTGTMQARFGFSVEDLGPAAGAAPALMTVTDRWNTAWGLVASASRSDLVNVTVQGTSVLSANFTAVAGRVYSAQFWAVGQYGQALNVVHNVLKLDDGTVTKGEQRYTVGTVNEQLTLAVSIPNFTTTPGVHNVYLEANYTGSGGVAFQGNWSPMRLVVTDIGPASGAVPVADPTPPWLTLPFTNGWAQKAAQATCRYRKIGDVVSVEGEAYSVAAAPNPAPFALLPVGFRPPQRIQWPLVVWNAGAHQYGLLYVQTDGVMGMGINVPWIAGADGPINCSFSVTP